MDLPPPKKRKAVMALPRQAECDALRRLEPRDAHEHALLAQLPEFYSAVAREATRHRAAMPRSAIAAL